MIEIIFIFAIVVGAIVAVFLLAPNTRNRGVKDITRTRRAAETAERNMDYRRDRVAEREQHRSRQHRPHRGY